MKKLLLLSLLFIAPAHAIIEGGCILVPSVLLLSKITAVQVAAATLAAKVGYSTYKETNQKLEELKQLKENK